MPQMAGQQIEEMADVRATRKRKIVLLCSSVCLAIIFTFCLVRFIEQNYFFASINFFTSIVLILNILYLVKHSTPKFSDLILSGVLLFHGVILLVYGQSVPDRLLWLYPITAIIIFANEFKTGVALSTGFFLVVLSSVLFSDSISYMVRGSQSIFLFSLFSLYLLCNISAYQYSKVMNYVQSLYKEGIEDLAYLDQLTGLANRWSFENWAQGKLEEKKESKNVTAMVFLDIDNFKFINDTYGHEVGDRVLQHFARRLKNNVRNKDRSTDKHDYSVARFAGDEFVLLLYDVKSKQDLEGILKRICGLFTDGYQSSQRINELTVSVGVALYPDDASTLAELTRCADKAMYAAKHGGKNQYRFYRVENQLEQGDSRNKEETLASVTSLKRG
ncbi:GGDEF domain-containing protein [Vibrio europaeus]|uniref:Diguanylate cyclase n=1 Tax=Vibrio europaeus TaxID=300876 RepID=A0A178J7I0_9VIBR|nr:GGDEF domain-containing protein [Vibrio europaeus]MDC5705304.1 GGDEF domain-containing protein [Vibrio europaeus]MDC5710583.1 GGDEF domain-containing protein [Vibrio europaeus]MDC5715673.1 GGDEF domain-containing protein [Vibrio europaeus]MDC5719834.1 GGDEF domain-containing protein [Vibrio europaeus]MDC5724278.1 GGDEF domain-containing protein [Vibrio europaeus]